MYKLKQPKNKKGQNSPFMAVVPNGKTLVGVLTSPKAVFDRLRKNSRDVDKIYSVNDN